MRGLHQPSRAAGHPAYGDSDWQAGAPALRGDRVGRGYQGRAAVCAAAEHGAGESQAGPGAGRGGEGPAEHGHRPGCAQAETQMLHQQDEQHQSDYSELEQQQLELQGEVPSVENRLQHVQVQVGWLEKTDVFGASFKIWHNGPLGIINDFNWAASSPSPCPGTRLMQPGDRLPCCSLPCPGRLAWSFRGTSWSPVETIPI